MSTIPGGGNISHDPSNGDYSLDQDCPRLVVVAAEGSIKRLLRGGVEGFLSSKEGRSENTLISYRDNLEGVGRKIAAELKVPYDEVQLDQITRPILRQAWAAWRVLSPRGGVSKRRAPGSMAVTYSVWSGLYSFLFDEGWVTSNPMKGIDKDSVDDPEPKSIAGGEESLLKLLQAADAPDERRRTDGGLDKRYRASWAERDVAILAVLDGTGIRLDPLEKLRPNSFYGPPEERMVRFINKGGKERCLPVTPEVDAAINRYLAARLERFPTHKLGPTSTAPLWVHATSGKPLTRDQITFLVERLFTRAGVVKPAGANVHAHRHTFATGLALQGASAREIQRLLLHGSMVTSQRYIDATGREIRSASESAPVNGVLAEFRAAASSLTVPRGKPMPRTR